MTESPVVNEWKAEAKRDDILRMLELKFPGQVPAEWVSVVKSEANLKVLSRWIDALGLATSPTDFAATSGIGRRG